MSSDILERSRALFTTALVFHTDVVAKSASGLYIDGADGKRYMDFSSGLATANIGHCPPSVVEAAKEQLDKMIHSGCVVRYASEVELAERLERITPKTIEAFFFSNSGAEAVEGAIKLARHVTGRQGIVAFTGGFHGRTLGAASLTTSSARYRAGYHPLLPSVFHSPYPYCFRCPMGKERETCSLECFGYLKNMLRHQITPSEVSCAVIEPVLGEGGYVVPPAEFLVELRKLCTETGILLVADEVQTGFGRTGRWFASSHFAIDPDIMTMGKGIASGFPLSAVGASREIMHSWPPGGHGTTFGGNPVSCAAAVATIDTIERDSLLENATKVGANAMERLRSIAKKNHKIGDVRGLGLMIGVELVDGENEPATELMETILKRCLDNGLIILECGTDKNVARLMPPIITTETEMQKGLDILEEALA